MIYGRKMDGVDALDHLLSLLPPDRALRALLHGGPDRRQEGRRTDESNAIHSGIVKGALLILSVCMALPALFSFPQFFSCSSRG